MGITVFQPFKIIVSLSNSWKLNKCTSVSFQHDRRVPLIIQGECVKPMSILADDKVREQFNVKLSPYIFANSGKKKCVILYLIQTLQRQYRFRCLPPQM